MEGGWCSRAPTTCQGVRVNQFPMHQGQAGNLCPPIWSLFSIHTAITHWLSLPIVPGSGLPTAQATHAHSAQPPSGHCTAGCPVSLSPATGPLCSPLRAPAALRVAGTVEPLAHIWARLAAGQELDSPARVGEGGMGCPCLGAPPTAPPSVSFQGLPPVVS